MSIRYSYHIGFVALLLATAACTQDELADDARLPEGQYPLQIAAVTLSVEGGEAQPWGAPQTRVSEKEDGNSSKFDADDKFAVQIDDKGEVGTYTVRDNNTVEAEVPLYWSDTGEHTVNAWYPDTEGTLDLRDQSQSLAYLLSGTGTGDYESPVELTFTHSLAKVRVTPTGDALGEVTSLQLYTYTQCTYEKGTVVQGSQEGWIEMKKCEYTDNGTTITCWEANVVPDYEITKLRANGNEERTLSSGITPVAGKFYNITLNYDKGYTDDGQGNYTVTSAEGLKNIAKLVNEEWKLGINITLTADIDLSGIDWTPIGKDDNKAYTGTFDGGNHTISGLTVNQTRNYVGLIGCIGSDGTVKNVKLENVNITGDGYFVGGVAGTNYGTIENCSVDGTLTNNRHYLGGVVGDNYGSIIGCSSSGTITGTSPDVGGIGGQSVGGTIMACYSVANIKGRSSSGGVLGQTNRETVVIACYHAKGNVTGEQSRMIGGVIGWNYGKVTACYWENNQEQGIGENQAGTGETTMVTDGDWQNAVIQMNAALQSAGSEWQYELTGALPTLKKQ